MKRSYLCALVLAIIAGAASAQEGQTPPAPKINETAIPQGALEGDRNLSLGVAMRWPFLIFDPTDASWNEANVWPGIAFSIGYDQYLVNNLSLGGSVGASFNSSINGRLFFMIPVMGSVGWTFADSLIQVPFKLKAGMVIRQLGTMVHTDLGLEPEAGFYYRVTPTWSLGGDAGVLIIPEFYNDPAQNRTGLSLDLKLGAVYHM